VWKNDSWTEPPALTKSVGIFTIPQAFSDRTCAKGNPYKNLDLNKLQELTLTPLTVLQSLEKTPFF
jgi:hypothetical protein